jgi:hypothetical protein
VRGKRERVNKNNIEWWSGRIEVISGDQEEAHSNTLGEEERERNVTRRPMMVLVDGGDGGEKNV